MSFSMMHNAMITLWWVMTIVVVVGVAAGVAALSRHSGS